ncbi:ABC transporter ATP-binding protein [Castellaniella caeni]|uniref:ABC transporter ATP-binding protein n=1 Tax=Castellaniella caeni TaxID=266123 RepID=UPI00083352EB|nr:ABC transporter ATP-binding protein [Castellaniella caeni]
MIEVRNLYKSYRDRSQQKRYRVFENLSFTIPEGRNVAILGRNGSGKSTLLRLLGGIDVPDRGRIITDKRISWPVGLSGGFQGSLTGRENVKFVARVQGARGPALRRIVDYVESFAEIGDYFDEPVKTYSSGMRGRVAFGLSLAFDFDYYLIDEAMSVGDAHFKKKAKDALKEKIGKSNILLVSHSMSDVSSLCDYVLLVRDGNVTFFDGVKSGIGAYQKT